MNFTTYCSTEELSAQSVVSKVFKLLAFVQLNKFEYYSIFVILERFHNLCLITNGCFLPSSQRIIVLHNERNAVRKNRGLPLPHNITSQLSIKINFY